MGIKEGYKDFSVYTLLYFFLTISKGYHHKFFLLNRSKNDLLKADLETKRESNFPSISLWWRKFLSHSTMAKGYSIYL